MDIVVAIFVEQVDGISMVCEVLVCKTVGTFKVIDVRCFAGGYNYLHVEKPASPRKPLAELSSDPDYVS